MGSTTLSTCRRAYPGQAADVVQMEMGEYQQTHGADTETAQASVYRHRIGPGVNDDSGTVTAGSTIASP